MTFTKDGIKYIAKKGFCEARKEKDNSLVFSASDVWKDKEPTKEDVLTFEKLFVKMIANKLLKIKEDEDE